MIRATTTTAVRSGGAWGRRCAARLVSVRLVSSVSSIPNKVSHVVGACEPPVSDHTLGTLLAQTCRHHGEKPAVIAAEQGTTLKYNELDKLSSNLAANMSTLVAKGDKVAVCCGNRWEFLVIQMGLGKLGAVLVPLNTAFTDEQYQGALVHCDAKLLITQRNLQKRQGKSRGLQNLIDYAQKGCDNIDKVVVIGEPSFDKLLEQPAGGGSTAAAAELSTTCDEIINMQFTSGTTSSPKLSSLTHRNIVNNGLFIGSRMGLTATQSKHPTGQDHLCVPVPMFHCFGLVLANLAAVSHGCTLVYPSESFDPVKTVRAVQEHQCTGLYGVPVMFAQELELHDEIAKGGLEYLSKGIAAGSSIPIELMKKLIKTFNLNELTICYGMTETSPVSIMTSPHDPLDKRTETVGQVMPNTEVKIVNPATVGDNHYHHHHHSLMEPLPLGSPGEIVVAGYLLQKEYYNDPVKTQSEMVTDSTGKRWMRTGDEGVMDAQGYVRVTGRIKDLIIRGGENIHPLDIENALFAHPEVSQAAVVGIPCDRYGESIAAFIIPHLHAKASAIDAQALKDHVRQQVGPFMTPEHVFVVADLPKTASGKIRKVELRDLANRLAVEGSRGVRK